MRELHFIYEHGVIREKDEVGVGVGVAEETLDLQWCNHRQMLGWKLT